MVDRNAVGQRRDILFKLLAQRTVETLARIGPHAGRFAGGVERINRVEAATGVEAAGEAIRALPFPAADLQCGGPGREAVGAAKTFGGLAFGEKTAD